MDQIVHGAEPAARRGRLRVGREAEHQYAGMMIVVQEDELLFAHDNEESVE